MNREEMRVAIQGRIKRYNDIKREHDGENFGTQRLKHEIEALQALLDREEELTRELEEDDCAVGCQEIMLLQQQVAQLKEGICEHVANNELRSGCKLCDLAVAGKGYPIWVEKAKKLEAQLSRVTEASLHETYHKSTGEEITLTIAKGLKAIVKDIHEKSI